MKVALSVFLQHLGKQKGQVLIFKLFYQKIQCFINQVPLLGDTETELSRVATRICLYCTIVLPPRISSVYYQKLIPHECLDYRTVRNNGFLIKFWISVQLRVGYSFWFPRSCNIKMFCVISKLFKTLLPRFVACEHGSRNVAHNNDLFFP